MRPSALVKTFLVIVILGVSIPLFSPVQAVNYGGPAISWNTFKSELRQEALAKGIRPEVFDNAFANIHKPDRKTLHLDRTQPERRLTFLKYRNTRGDAYRIQLGQKKYRRYQDLLDTVGNQFGVDPCMITALWGIESSYGHYLGNFPVIKSLATLAYDNRRGAFFRKELFYALQILNEGHVDPNKFVGEWAGASGQPQFLPSSWYKFAIDYDHDGYKDIWTNRADAFASIANYLKQNGWQTSQPWYIEVDLPYNFDESLLGKEHQASVSDWYNLGVQPINGHDFPTEDLQASIIHPHGGPHLMIFKNFNVLLRYNNSNFYAGTVGYIASKICRKI